MRFKPSKVTLQEASTLLKTPLYHLLQVASEGELRLYAVAAGWKASKKQITDPLEGWVKLDAKDLIQSLNKDHVMVRKVSCAGQSFTLDTPTKVFLGAVYIEIDATLEQSTSKPEVKPKSPTKASHEEEKGEELLDPNQAAKAMGYAASTLAKYRSNGEGPAYQKSPKGTIRYRRKDLMAWIEGK